MSSKYNQKFHWYAEAQRESGFLIKELHMNPQDRDKAVLETWNIVKLYLRLGN